MFYHVKELQFDARVSRPDPGFGSLLLEQFGGANGELSAALRYFVQAFAAKKPYPDKYDLLMDIATEEFSHLEIVGATIQMLLSGVNGQLKDAADQAEIMQLLHGKESKEHMIHNAMMNPEFFTNAGGGLFFMNATGGAWTANYINADLQGDLTVELRSDIAAESRAKLVYEYLLQFTDDPAVKDTLHFLMTREVAHYQMFEAALASIKPNFPPGVLQGDAGYSNLYFNMSSGTETGPWNQGESPVLGETWQYIEDPIQFVMESNGLTEFDVKGTSITQEEVESMNKNLSKERSGEINSAVKPGPMQWQSYGKRKE